MEFFSFVSNRTLWETEQINFIIPDFIKIWYIYESFNKFLHRINRIYFFTDLNLFTRIYNQISIVPSSPYVVSGGLNIK